MTDTKVDFSASTVSTIELTAVKPVLIPVLVLDERRAHERS